MPGSRAISAWQATVIRHWPIFAGEPPTPMPPRPDLILMDLNLPIRSGHDVLAEIKSDPDLKRIPVVVLSTSRAEEDVIRAYNAHANCFISKPLDFDQLTAVVSSTVEYWLCVVRLGLVLTVQALTSNLATVTGDGACHEQRANPSTAG